MTTPAMPLTDAELIERTRTGDMTAYDELYRRHLDGAQRVARVVTGSHDEAQDVVSEAFTRVLDRLQHGGGPEGELGPYLNTIVRRLAIDRYRASRRDGLPADPTLFEVMPETDDPIARSTDRDLVRRAFETLPDRWQQVLWHTEIEGRTPAALAPTLGSTPNAVAALAYRAREGLRQAYLAVHLSADIPAECRPYVPKLAAYVRGTLSPREDEWVAAHVEDCPHCRDRRDELMLLVADLRGVLWPALLLPVVLGGTKTAAAVTGAAAAGVMGAKAGAAAGAGAGGAKAGAGGDRHRKHEGGCRRSRRWGRRRCGRCCRRRDRRGLVLQNPQAGLVGRPGRGRRCRGGRGFGRRRGHRDHGIRRQRAACRAELGRRCRRLRRTWSAGESPPPVAAADVDSVARSRRGSTARGRSAGRASGRSACRSTGRRLGGRFGASVVRAVSHTDDERGRSSPADVG